MKRTLFILLILAAGQLLIAQQDLSTVGKDPAAKKILDRVARQAKADYPLKVSFDYIYESLQENQRNKESGTLILQNDKFRLSVSESEIYCDGKTMWNHLATANEVYVSDPEEKSSDDEFFLSNPAELFTFYQEDFKYRLTREIEFDEIEYFEIDLFPNNLQKSFHTIKLLIRKNDHQLFSAQTLGKHGDNHSVVLRDYQSKVPVTEGTFVFDPSGHPGVEVVDTRF